MELKFEQLQKNQCWSIVYYNTQLCTNLKYSIIMILTVDIAVEKHGLY